MSFTENLIYLTLREEKLKIGDEKYLREYEIIEKNLEKEKIKNIDLMLPWQIMLTCIFLLKIGLYFLLVPIVFNINEPFLEIVDNIVGFMIALKLDKAYYFLIITILVSSLAVLLINKKISSKIKHLKKIDYNVNKHLIELDEHLKIYKETDIYKLMLKNKSNMFGLLVLLFILKAIYFDVIKHLDWYFYPAWKIIWKII